MVSESVLCPVNMMMGALKPFLRRMRTASRPSTSGSPTSMITRSICPALAVCTPLVPLSTAIGSNSSCSASCSTSASRSSESSSTIRILRVFVIPRPQDRHHPGTAFARNRAFGGKRTSRFATYIYPTPIGLGHAAITRGKDERRAAGNEGIGNRRGGLAVEIGVEDRKVEVGAVRCFQRLVDARGFGGDGVAEFAEHVLKQHADHHLVFDDEDPLGLRRGLRFGCHPSPLRWNRHASRSDRSNDALRLPWGEGLYQFEDICRAETAWGPAAWSPPPYPSSIRR